MKAQENKQIYYVNIDTETNLVEGFYCKEIHGDNIPKNVVAINEELWQHLLTLGQIEVDLKNIPSMPVLTEGEAVLEIEAERYFSKFIPETVEEPFPPSEVDILKETVQKQGREISEIKEMMTSIFNILKEK